MKHQAGLWMWSVVCLSWVLLCGGADRVQAELRVGAAVQDISPEQFPVLVNGGMTSREAKQTLMPLSARALVLNDGAESVAIVVVDSCMLPRPLLDDAKQIAARRTGIPVNRILISATHTHTAPSAMACLGTDVDEAYVPFLRDRLAKAIETAQSRMQPAKVGWGTIDASAYTAVRRWIYRSDRVQNDPFGNPTVRANMHAGANWDNVTGPSGPEDPLLSLISFQTLEGQPLAVLANFSMHYFGVGALHPDYFGLFSEGLMEAINGQAGGESDCVAMMSHGCSGDIWRKNYMLPADQRNDQIPVEQYTGEMIDLALKCYQGINYQSMADLAMQEARLEMKYRVPNVQLLEWAQRIVAEMGDALPKNREQVYAREQIILHERQSTEIVLQAIRIGEIAIATTPNETYALTGLKLKMQSPLPQTMVIELANGGDGYIPPPEQHVLGGYNTWPARSAGLEVQAEPKIVAKLLELLEQVAGKPRRMPQPEQGKLAEAVLKLQPTAYYRLEDFAGMRAVDASPQRADAIFEPGIVFFLEGPESKLFSGQSLNRSVHFSGGRLNVRLPQVEGNYTVSLWVWNGMPVEGRDVCGWLWGRGEDFDAAELTEQLGIQGTAGEPGRLCFQAGGAEPVLGKTALPRFTWQHVILVREGDEVRLYLNGQTEPDLQGKVPAERPVKSAQFFAAGRPDRQAGFEGRLDEIAVYDRVLSAEERKQISPAPTPE